MSTNIRPLISKTDWKQRAFQCLRYAGKKKSPKLPLRDMIASMPGVSLTKIYTVVWGDYSFSWKTKIKGTKSIVCIAVVKFRLSQAGFLNRWCCSKASSRRHCREVMEHFVPKDWQTAAKKQLRQKKISYFIFVSFYTMKWCIMKTLPLLKVY